MKAAWAALGIILLLSSIVIVVAANLGTNQRTDVQWGLSPSPGGMPNSWSAYNSWNVSGTLNQGDFFKVEIYAPSDWTQIGGWGEPAGGSYAVPYKPSFVNISDPSGAQTEFECDFLLLSSNPSIRSDLVFYNITGTGPNETVQAHGIDTVRFEIPYGDNYPGIVARALSGGTYTANMTWLFGGGSPPFNMTLSRGVPVTTKTDRTNLYPVGLGVFAVSVVSLVYGFKDSKKTVPKRKAKAR